jgi:hypothetical protein
MAIVMTANNFVNIAKDIANNKKTLYVYACFGAPMNAANKKRYTNNNSYNKQASRKNKIMNASSNTFGFDCVCLLKGILWGWNGNVNATYGGAKHASNGVADVNADTMYKSYCYDRSTNFSNIIPGEFVWMSGHIGVYIGNGLVVECTPIWKDGVQITALANLGKKAGYNNRTWSGHGKSIYLDYSGAKPDNFFEDSKGKGYYGPGDNSKHLQNVGDFLYKTGLFGPYFGDYLKEVVKVYQRKHNLEADGNIGPLTYASLKSNGFKE